MKYNARLTIYSNTKPTEFLDFESNSKGRLLSKVLKTVEKLDNNDIIQLGLSHNYIKDGHKCYEPCEPLNSIVEIFTKEELVIKIKNYFNSIIFLD